MKLNCECKPAMMLVALLVAACTNTPSEPLADDMPVPSLHGTTPPRKLSVAGGVKILVTAPAPAIGEAKSQVEVQQIGDAAPTGTFRMVRMRAGFTVDFTGTVTCMAVEQATGRAWIGGVVTANNSDDPVHSTAIHQPGRDVWFRVMDGGEGAGALADRSSVYGFEGAAGIITSAEYCAARLWPADNANAFAVIKGNLGVVVRN